MKHPTLANFNGIIVSSVFQTYRSRVALYVVCGGASNMHSFVIMSARAFRWHGKGASHLHFNCVVPDTVLFILLQRFIYMRLYFEFLVPIKKIHSCSELEDQALEINN